MPVANAAAGNVDAQDERAAAASELEEAPLVALDGPAARSRAVPVPDFGRSVAQFCDLLGKTVAAVRRHGWRAMKVRIDQENVSIMRRLLSEQQLVLNGGGVTALAERWEFGRKKLSRCVKVHAAFSFSLWLCRMRLQLRSLVNMAKSSGGRAKTLVIRLRYDETPMRVCIVDDGEDGEPHITLPEDLDAIELAAWSTILSRARDTPVSKLLRMEVCVGALVHLNHKFLYFRWRPPVSVHEHVADHYICLLRLHAAGHRNFGA